MGIGSWLYTNSTKNLRVKIVHPGGHAELHDRPVLVSEIIRRNPKCCVAHPNVFKQPWAIVQPDTMLMPGQKVYVVPISTVRKLQKLSIKRSGAIGQDGQSFKKLSSEEDEDGESDTSCCSMEDGDASICMKSFKSGDESEERKSCFTCMFASGKQTSGSTPTRGGQRNRNQGESPKKLITDLDYWQPNLHSIVEERSINPE
ncbi:unnamed protein product [Lactuca virosa]|uniref:Uncharacterized protein n=1 Tax=Lactuca virosa TaxID=75947 RepID=A0AAU9M3Z1_9ASTR|nr:unnamed protein product [Lactuca virosa]